MDKQDSFVPLCHTHSHKYTKGIGRWWYVCCVNFVHKITRHNFTRSLSFVVAVTLFQPSEQPNRIGACVHINELFFLYPHSLNEWIACEWKREHRHSLLHLKQSICFACTHRPYTQFKPIQLRTWHQQNRCSPNYEFVGCSCAYRFNYDITTDTHAEHNWFRPSPSYSCYRVIFRTAEWIEWPSSWVRAVFFSVHQPTNRSA